MRKKKHSKRSATHRWDRFLDLTESDDGVIFGDEPENERFDVQRWRDDLAERSRERDRMRRSDVKRGLFSGVRHRREVDDVDFDVR